MRIIINADDLGRNDIVNGAIFNLLNKKLITSASILPNSKDLAYISEKIKDHPGCSFGIHFYLTEFKPLTKNMALNPLAGDDGTFFRNKKNIKNAKYDKELKKAIYNELVCQLDMLKLFNIPVDHIDSHHHVHLIPWLVPVIKDIQKKYSIKIVRLKSNLYNYKNEKYLLLKLLNAGYINWLIKYYKYKAITTDKFGSLQTFIEILEERKTVLSKCTIELSVHPGHEKYTHEGILLNEIEKLKKANQIKLISYLELLC